MLNRGNLEASDFPSFSEGLSLRDQRFHGRGCARSYFPSFSEGLSLRAFRGFFKLKPPISLPFRRDFH